MPSSTESADEFQQIADGLWDTRDYERLAATLTRVQTAAADTTDPADRARLADVIRRFVTTERLNLIILDFIGGAIDPLMATRFWDFVPDEVIWPILLDTWNRLPDGETRTFVHAAIRQRLVTNMELLRQTLASSDPARLGTVLALLDERTERLFILAMRGLRATGERGLERVRAIASGEGKPAEIARKALEG